MMEVFSNKDCLNFLKSSEGSFLLMKEEIALIFPGSLLEFNGLNFTSNRLLYLKQ
jgi:hypothetical protein